MVLDAHGHLNQSPLFFSLCRTHYYLFGFPNTSVMDVPHLCLLLLQSISGFSDRASYAQDGLELLTRLPPHPECCDDKQGSPHWPLGCFQDQHVSCFLLIACPACLFYKPQDHLAGTEPPRAGFFIDHKNAQETCLTHCLIQAFSQ